jgi:hypothetical protein
MRARSEPGQGGGPASRVALRLVIRWIVRRFTASRVVTSGWSLAGVALVVYGATASPWIVDGDNAEFAALGAIGGRAHPSGYPLYVLWLRAWSWLPGGPAYRAALATAVLGALAVVALHAACRAWGARSLAATIAAAIFGAAPVVVRYHCEAEVFAMNNLVAALVLWLAAVRGPLRGMRRAAALGLVAGLGLSDHLTCVLVAPVGVLGVLRAARESRAWAYAAAGVALVVGLSPYAYLWFADGPASWGRVDTAADLLAMVARRDYGVTSLMTGGADVAWTASAGALVATLARSWLWLGAAAGVAMLGVRIARPAGETRAGWSALAASFVLAGPVLMARFNIEPRGVGLDICERFHILPALLLAVPVSAALDVACARVTRELAATIACAAAFVALAMADLPRLAALHSPAVELGVRNTLRALPPLAIAVVTGDDQCFGARYLQFARGERPDVAVVCAGLLPIRSYRAAWAARGIAMPASTGPRLGQALLDTGRPVVVDPLLAGVTSGFPSYPLGVLARILPRGGSPPAASEVAAINRDLYRGFALDYVYPGPDDGYATVAHHRYAASWAAIARLLDRAGDRDGARDAFALTGQLRPRAE